MGRHRKPRADYRAEAAWMLRLVGAVRADAKAPPVFVAQVQEQADKLSRLLLDESRRRDAGAKTEARKPRTDGEEGAAGASPVSDRAVG